MFLSNKDIMVIVCFSSGTASKLKRRVLDYSIRKGVISLGNNKCLARDFCFLYGLEIDEIKEQLKSNIK